MELPTSIRSEPNYRANVDSSKLVFLIIHKKAAIKSYLYSILQKRSFLPLKQQKNHEKRIVFHGFFVLQPFHLQ